FFFSSRRRHTRSKRDWSSDVCSSDLFPQFVSRWLRKYIGCFGGTRGLTSFKVCVVIVGHVYQDDIIFLPPVVPELPMAIYHIDMPHHVPPVDNWLSLSMLRLPVGVSQTGSLSGSAKVAGIAQSNASRTLKTLERRLGYPLLVRSPRGSTLTQEGQLTVEWAREALDAIDRLALGANALAHTKQTELTIVASMTIAEHLLPGWIGTFRSLYPGLNTKLKVMNSSEVIEAVE